MRKLLVYGAALVMALGAGCSGSGDTGNFKHVQGKDRAMNAAIAQARETSADFVRAFRKHGAGTKDFYVKKPYATPTQGHEHMWISVTAETNGVLLGVIANDAEETREVKLGDVVSVKIDEICDWKYQDGNRLIGGYTVRYFVDRMSPREKADFLKDAGFVL